MFLVPRGTLVEMNSEVSQSFGGGTESSRESSSLR